MLVTIPLGHNPGLDDAIRSHRLTPSREAFLMRGRGGWIEVDGSVAFDAIALRREEKRYGRNPPTEAIWIAELGPS
jgi:hypothetical protein